MKRDLYAKVSALAELECGAAVWKAMVRNGRRKHVVPHGAYSGCNDVTVCR